MIRRLARAACALLLAVLILPAAASAGPADEAEAIRRFLADPAQSDAPFAPSFLADIPLSDVRQLAANLARAYGRPLAVRDVRPLGPSVTAFRIDYERASVSMRMTLSDAATRPVIGWIVTGSQMKDDSAARIASDMAALPGSSALLVQRLGAEEVPVIAVHPDRRHAIASSFKLWVLAEAGRQVKAGKRRWRDVIPLGAPSLPSGITQDWPKAAPMTLHSLATLTIALSDNSAADTLITALGRESVLKQADGGNAGMPVLLTREAFALKMPAEAGLRADIRAAAAQDRTRLLEAAGARLVKDRTDPAMLTQPRHIDMAEWFASPSDLVTTLDRIRQMESPALLEMLAIHPGLPMDDAARFAYIGYKGGQEAGVMSHTWLLRTRDGRWYGVSGVWNNPDALLDRERFTVLVRRALALIPNP